MAEYSYQIVPLVVGTCSLGKDHVLGDEYGPDDRIEFALISFLIRGHGRNVLVDLGPKSLDYTNAMFRRYGFFRTMPDGSTPDDIVQTSGNVFDGLAAMDVKPEDITDVIFTHLHADHHGMDDGKDGGACEDFPNATFHVSKTGWDHNVESRAEGRWNSYIDWGFGDCMLRKLDEGKLAAQDNARIAPGLETVYLGGHSICSQGVRVETDYGSVLIASDDLYRYDLLQDAVVARIFTTRERLVEVSGMLADAALDWTIIVPVHDPVVLKLYEQHGNAWLNEALIYSLNAGEGYRRKVPGQ